MGVIFNVSGTEVEKKWQIIRGQYRREKKKIESNKTSGCGTADIKKANWFAYEHLAFLNNSFSPELTLTTTESIEQQVNDFSQDIFVINESENENQETSKEVELQHGTLEENQKSKGKEKSLKLIGNKQKRKNEDPRVTMAMDVLNEVAKKNKRDEFEVYGENLANKLRNVNNRSLLLRVQHDIDNLIYDAIMQNGVYSNYNISLPSTSSPPVETSTPTPSPGACTTYFNVDYVYFETSSTSPYLIRRIEELSKTPSGNVEAKVMCFYRRRDLPNPLVQLADKHQMATAEDSPLATKLKKTWLRTPVGEEQAAQAVLDPSIVSLDEERSSPNNSPGIHMEKQEILTPKQRHQIKHRELFLSRQVETLPATHIRGKCSVTLLNETESLTSYLSKDDVFFYCLVFDPNQKTLLADKGEIRVGSRYQTEVPPLLKEIESDERKLENLETLMWSPNHLLTDRKIDQFLVVSRSIGTFARALDCSSSVKQPSLHMSAAAASRDITLFHAMDTLHRHSYNIEEAMCSLVPFGGPVLCRDEMEEWSASEANLFEEALDKYGKDFNDIRQDFLPWKTLKNIVEYYYMWKTTDRYVQQKRVKAVEAESKLKQVYIPNYKSNSLITNSTKGVFNGTSNSNGDNAILSGKPCESCATISSLQWYPWGPLHMNYRLCQTCWSYWKKYGGLKIPTRLTETDAETMKKRMSSEMEDEPLSEISNRQQHRCSIVNCGKEFKLKTHLARHYAQAHGIAIRSGSPRPIMKTRTAFYLHTTPATRLSRILCRNLIKPRKAARQPSFLINIAAVKQEFSLQLAAKSPTEIKRLFLFRKRDRGSVTKIANRLGSPGSGSNDWLVLTPKENLPQPEKIAFPKPPKAPDGSLLYERVPNKLTEQDKAAVNTSAIKKRPFEELNGLDSPVMVGPPTKRPNKDPMPSHRPSPEQYAAMMAAAAAAGHPLPRHHLNGKPKIAQMARTGSGRKQVISWMDAPDDVYFRATEASKKARKVLSVIELRRAARKPWRHLPTKLPIVSAPSDLQVVILD